MNTQSIHLQAIGQHPAKPASQLQVGERRVYNYGQSAEIVALERKGKSVYITTRSDKDGSTYVQRHGSEKLVAFR